MIGGGRSFGGGVHAKARAQRSVGATRAAGARRRRLVECDRRTGGDRGRRGVVAVRTCLAE